MLTIFVSSREYFYSYSNISTYRWFKNFVQCFDALFAIIYVVSEYIFQSTAIVAAMKLFHPHFIRWSHDIIQYPFMQFLSREIRLKQFLRTLTVASYKVYTNKNIFSTFQSLHQVARDKINTHYCFPTTNYCRINDGRLMCSLRVLRVIDKFVFTFTLNLPQLSPISSKLVIRLVCEK